MERVFIFDEDIKARSFLYELISELGWGVHTVASGSVILDLLKNERPGLIILAEQEGEFCGFSLVKKIRIFDKDVKIIVFFNPSSGPCRDPEQVSRESDISAYLPKDFQDPCIIKDIVSVLNQQSYIKPEGIAIRGKILVVDDELEGRETVANFLRRRGFAADVALSGEECLEKIKQKTFDLVLLDISLAGMDGLLTLKRIKEINPNIKVIMSTGLVSSEVMEQARSLGAADYLMKPFNFGSLEASLVSLLITEKRAER
ncbi:MAG: response regulator [Candidatus Omnitrophica bacterium]|jgi:DNA-binding response OmpR family regulator|nr:response regulator [Candidatus Omnitrophota bacterium]